jgi:hypothetical protein
MEHDQPSAPTCAGCGRSFTPSGLTSHLKQTHNPRCHAIHDQQRNYIPEDHPPLDNDFPDSDHFPGDFFADDYGPDDFPWNADEDPDPDDAESLPPDSEVNEFETDLDPDPDDFYQDPEIGWEPPIADPGVHVDDEDHDMDEDGDGDPPPILPERSTAHDALQNPHSTEKFNDKYADARAGLCIGTEPDTNSQYHAGMLNNMNTWFPFSSKLDWEVARWAKLRGPTSTAFSELLAIDGVSDSQSFHTVLDLINAHRFMSAWDSRIRIR